MLTLRLSQLFTLEKYNSLMQPKQQKQNHAAMLSVADLLDCPRRDLESSCHDVNGSAMRVSHIYALLRIFSLFISGAVTRRFKCIGIVYTVCPFPLWWPLGRWPGVSSIGIVYTVCPFYG